MLSGTSRAEVLGLVPKSMMVGAAGLWLDCQWWHHGGGMKLVGIVNESARMKVTFV